MAEPRPALGLAAALAVVGLWSGFLLISRFGIRADVAAVDLAALRFGVSGVVMLPVLWVLGFGGLAWWQAAFLAVSGGLGFGLFVYTGFTMAPAAYAAILLPGVLPLYTTLLAWAVLGDRLTAARALPLALIATGIGALAIAALVELDGQRLWGAACFLVGSFSWACLTIALRHWHIEAVRGTAVVAVLAGAVYVPIYLLFLPVGLGQLGWPTLIVQGFYQGICAVVLALLAFTFAVRHLGPTTTTMITATTPAVVAVSAIFVLDEPVTPSIALGVAAVVAGGILTARAAARAR
ncbi:MAG: DMT family transporter [Pseudomonadota bacterium]